MAGIGFFAPLPIALMIPFMASQSLAMGEAFGKGFQYGKRKISAMTNEEFNKLSAKQMHIETTAEIASMIPNMKQSMSNFSTLQPEIIKELLSYAMVIGKELVTFGTDVITDTAETAAQFDYLKSFTDWIMNQGAANEQATLDLLNKAGVSAEARVGMNDRQADAAVAAKARHDLNNIQSELDHAKKIAAEVALKSANLRPDQQGPTVEPRNIKPPQAPNTLTVDKFGNLTNIDTRGDPKKPRAPSSICIQIRKYTSEASYLDTTIAEENARNRIRLKKGPLWKISSISTKNLAKWKKRLKLVYSLRTGLHNKYDTSGCKK